MCSAAIGGVNSSEVCSNISAMRISEVCRYTSRAAEAALIGRGGRARLEPGGEGKRRISKMRKSFETRVPPKTREPRIWRWLASCLSARRGTHTLAGP